MNYGDVGCVLELFPYYIAIFTATGKDKYATHMIKFYTDLNHVYPPHLHEVILQNWLCNPKGTADEFQAMDWLQELNNLYTKVIFAGQSPNRTKELVFKHSVLLEVYCSMQQTIEENFYLTRHTVRHSKPKMTKTLQRLRDQLAMLAWFEFKAGRSTSTPTTGRSWVVHDAINEGFGVLVRKKTLYSIGDNSTEQAGEAGQVTGEDLGVV